MKVLLTPRAQMLMALYTNSVATEISGIAHCAYDKELQGFVVDDVKIFVQEVTAATASIEGEDVAKFCFDMTKAGESLEGWSCWWHSHADMAVFWSGTDTGTMDENPFGAPSMLSVVTNHKGEYRARFDTYEPIHMFADELPVSVLFERDEKLEAEILAEVKEKVTAPKVVSTFAQPHYNFAKSQTDFTEQATVKEITEYDTVGEIEEMNSALWTIKECTPEEVCKIYDLDELENCRDLIIDGNQITAEITKKELNKVKDNLFKAIAHYEQYTTPLDI